MHGALEAQLALKQFRAPRRLTAEQKSSLTERMSVFTGTTFAIATGSAEAVDFGIDIAESLQMAGWRWIGWPMGGIVTKPPGGRPEMGLDMMRGIETHIFDESLKPLAAELFQALADTEYKSQWVIMPPARAGHEHTVIIIIGNKE